MKWIEGDKLTDPDFASDIALLDNTWDGIKHLTEKAQMEAAKVELAINPDKTSVMKIGKWQETDRVVIGKVPIEDVDRGLLLGVYLGSVMSSNGRCDKEIKARCLGKENVVFGRLESEVMEK